MRKFDQYKRLIVFIAAFVILLMHSVVFWFFLHWYYNIIWQPFFRRGSWVMVALYAMLIFVFTKIYGGFRVGYYKSSEVLISQILGLLFVNGIIYLQISLLALGFVNAVPLLIMSAIDVVIIIIWTFISNAIYKRLFPPRKMILLYGDRAPDTLIEKMSTRKDKYQICAAMNVNKGYDAIIKVIHDFDAVIVWDIPSSLRNPIVKYCFGHSIRTYIMPKLSDIIIMRASDINLFDTPLLLSRNIGLTFDQKIMKRIMDLVLSILLLVLTLHL